MIHTIIAEINKSNSTNHKLSVLKKYKDSEILQRVLKMTYDHVQFTYGVSTTQVEKFQPDNVQVTFDFEHALNSLEQNLASRSVTGHAALQHVANLIGGMERHDADLFKKVINRDLRIGVGKTQINKVWKGLITKPVYMRCDVYNKKTSKNIKFPAVVQLKADGTYREFSVKHGVVKSCSRSGEEYDYPVIFDQIKYYPDGYYIGELTVDGIADRAKGNGLINSDNPPHDDIVLELWDYITPDEYVNASLKDRKNPCRTQYVQRLEALKRAVHSSKNVRIIPTVRVENLKEALQKTSEWMTAGFEGSILKDLSGAFKDGTSKHQLKLKLQIDAEVRITGFHEGTKGTKREGKIGSLIFENDEGTIKGKCSGFTDAQLDEFTSKQDELLGKVITVQFNDLSKAEGNDFYALSHPRFIEVRNDKDETDTLSKVQKLREMAMELE